jgi:hypothetical protein
MLQWCNIGRYTDCNVQQRPHFNSDANGIVMLDIMLQAKNSTVPTVPSDFRESIDIKMLFNHYMRVVCTS